MTTETIDVVINPGTGARQVVRDLNDIANTARTAGTNVQQLQQSINSLGSNSGLSRFQSQLNAVNTQLQQMNQQMASMGNGLNRIGQGSTTGLGTMASAIRGLLSVMVVKTIMDWSDAWVAAEGKIRTLAPTMADAQQVMQRLFQVAQETRAPIDKLAQLYHVMTISAKDLGASQNDMIRVTETVAKALAVQGASFQQARGAILQLSQAFGTGRVRAQEFNSLMQGTPLLLSLVAKNIDAAGGSVAKLRQIMLSGKLSSAEFFEALLKAGTQADELFKSAPKTFSQAFTVLKNAIEQYVGTLAQASGTSTAFFNIMEALSKNIDNTARSLALMGVVLLALPFGPLGVAIAAAAAGMALFGDKILAGIDHTTTLKDVSGVVFNDFLNALNSVQVKLSDFGGKWLPDLQRGFETIGNTTLVDMARNAAVAFDTMIQGATGAVEGIKTAFMLLPTVIDEVGKRMFNALVTNMQAAINFIIDGINKVSSFVGQDMLSHVKIETANIDPKAFERAGADIGKAVSDGMKSAGTPIATYLEDALSRAGKISAERFHDEFRKAEINSRNANLDARGPRTSVIPADAGAANRAARDQMSALNNLFAAYKQNAQEMTDLEHHKEVMLKAEYDSGLMNFKQYSDQLESLQGDDFEAQKKLLDDTLTKLQDQQTKVQQALAGKKGATSQEQANELEQYRIKVEQLTGSLDKLKQKEEERIAVQEAAKLKPFNDFTTNMDAQIAQMNQALQQDREKLQIQGQINQMSERDFAIQQGIVQLVDPYLQQLNKVEAKMQEMRNLGLFDPNNPASVNAMNQMEAEVDHIKQIILQIPQVMGPALAQAFDAHQIAQFSKNLREGIADAIATGVFEGGKAGGIQLRKFLEEELLRKPFKMIIEALIKPITDLLASGVSSVVNGIIGGAGSMLGGGGSMLGTVGSALGIGGGGAAAAAGGFEAGFTGTAAISGAAGVGAGAGIGMIGTLGIYGAIAYGAYKIFDSIFGSKGGPKQGGYAGVASPSGASAIGAQDTQNAQLVQQLTQTITDLNNNFNRMAALTGRPGAQFGIGASTDPSGNSSSFLEVNARDPNGNVIFSKASTDIGRDAAAMTAAIAQFTQEATAGAMAANGITQAMVDQATAAQQAGAAAAQAGDATANAALASQQAAAAAAAQGATVEQQAAAANAAAAQAVVNAGLIQQLDVSLSGMGVAASNLVMMSDSAKISLINLSGGLSNLQAGMQQYFSIFFSEEEQRQALIQQVNATLAAGGVALNAATATRDQFRALAQSLDLNTAAGQAAFAAMMSVAGAFGQLTDNSKALAAAAAAEAQARADAQAAQMRADQERQHQEMMAAQERARQEAEAARQQAAWEAEQARLKAERDAEQQREASAYEQLRSKNMSDLQAAYQKERSDLEGVISATQQWGNSLKDFKAGLKTGSNSPYTPTQRYANARTEYDKTLSDLSSGDMNTRSAAQGNFQNVANTFLEASRTVNASSTQYQMDYAQVLADTDRAISINETQQSVAQQQLTALNNSVSALIDINGGVKSVVEALRAFGVGQPFAPYDASKRYMPGDTASYGGVNYTASAASADIFNINSNPYWSPQWWTPNSPIQSQQQVQPWDSHRHYQPGEVVVDVDGHWYKATDLSASSWNENSGPLISPQFWTQVPGHAQGLDYVPRDNYVFRAHQGEAVLTARQAQDWRGGQGIDLSPLLMAFNSLKQELAELREQHAHGVQADLAAQEKAALDVSERIVDGISAAQERTAYKSQQRGKATVT